MYHRKFTSTTGRTGKIPRLTGGILSFLLHSCYNLNMDMKKYLSQKTKKELNTLARELKIKNYSRLKKQKLVNNILAKHENEHIRQFLAIPWWFGLKQWWDNKPHQRYTFTAVGIMAIAVIVILAGLGKPSAPSVPRSNITAEQLKTAMGDEIFFSKHTSERQNILDELAKGKTKNAIKYLSTLLEIKNRDNRNNIAAIWTHLGEAWEKEENFPKAAGYYLKALELDIDEHGKDSKQAARDYVHLGRCRYAQGGFQRAIQNYENALRINRLKHGKEHPDVGADLTNLGLAWYGAGNFKRAVDYYRQAQGVKSHPDMASNWYNLAQAWFKLREYDKTAQCAEKAIETEKALPEPSALTLARAENTLGLVYIIKGNTSKAAEYFEKALDRFRKELGDNHPDTLSVKENLQSVPEKPNEPKEEPTAAPTGKEPAKGETGESKKVT